jgi:cytidylate kinase
LKTPSIIAIDGPAGSGKSTVGERLAARLSYLYFDTGVMYRAVTWAALQSGTPIEDETGVTGLAKRLQIDVQPPLVADGRLYTVLADGQDITWDIRSEAVDAAVSPVSAYARVRRVLTDQMRRIGQRGRVVMVGRDIGTVVFPEADLKIYLDASIETRSRRRYLEGRARGSAQTESDVLEAMRRRDQIDSSRAHAPLRAAADARYIDTTELDVDEVVAEIVRAIGVEESRSEIGD